MASIEGSYSIHYAKSPQGYDHPDVAALQLSASVLNATESYLWKSIRGAGLAYGARIEVDMESGLCGFSVYRVGFQPTVLLPGVKLIFRRALMLCKLTKWRADC